MNKSIESYGSAKKGYDVMLDTTDFLWSGLTISPCRSTIFGNRSKKSLYGVPPRLQEFKRLEERGYGDLLLNRYPSLRKYFADFIRLPFVAKAGNEHLIQAIEMVRALDAGDVKRLPQQPHRLCPKSCDAPCVIRTQAQPQCVEMDWLWRSKMLALRRPLPAQSKQHVSFWDLTLSDTRCKR